MRLDSILTLTRRRRHLANSRTSWKYQGNTEYAQYKEAARALIHARLVYWNQFYHLTWNRVAIRNQRRRWGSCSSLGNLNFSYKLNYLPPCLLDYVVLHELCHLRELNHSPRFWAAMAEQMPDYAERLQRLRRLEREVGIHPTHLRAHAHKYCCGNCAKTEASEQ